MANVQTDVPAAVEKTRKLIDGEHTVDELVSIIKKQQFGEEGLIRDWGKKTELERLVEAEREKQEKKKLKREAKARRKEMASESKVARPPWRPKTIASAGMPSSARRHSP